MSQEKVRRYKEEKANRKEIMKKQKVKKIMSGTVAAVVCVAIVGWIGYSGVEYYQDNKPRKQVEADYTAVNKYIEALSK